MKKYLLLFVAVFALSCSSSDDGLQIDVTPDAMSINGTEVNILNVQYFREYENSFWLKVTTAGMMDLFLEFDKYGNFINAETLDAQSTHLQSHPYFSGHFVNFEMTPIKMSEGKCVIDFSGSVFQDRFDLSSPSITIAGHLNLDSPTPDPGPDWMHDRGIYAKVGSKNWLSPAPVWYVDNLPYQDRYYVCDGVYRLSINLVKSDPQTGQYNFTAASDHNYIRIEKYNVATNTYQPWSTTGNLKITSIVEPFAGGYYATGTFSARATNPANPSEQVEFKNGVLRGLQL